MKITGIVVFVTINDSLELHQVLIKNDSRKALIAMMESGMFHDKDVLLSDKVCESIMLTKEGKVE